MIRKMKCEDLDPATGEKEYYQIWEETSWEN